MWLALTACFKPTSGPSFVSDVGPVNETDNSFFEVLKKGQTEYQHAIFIDISKNMHVYDSTDSLCAVDL